MLDVCLLGTGGTVPLPERWLTSCLLKYKGNEVLIDCGEGTQIALHQHGLSLKRINTILLTHYHADHTAGLPGLLLSMAKADRTEPITIIGPRGLEQILQGVAMIARYVPFEVRYVEITEKEKTMEIDGMQVTAFAVKHSVTCYSYRFDIARNPKFDVEKAKANDVPLVCWNRLQKGETVEHEGRVFTPDMVTGNARKGLKMVYSTDTRPVSAILKNIMDADLYIGEGMYGDLEKVEKAKENLHSMMYETAELAAKGNVKELWLTHYSPSMADPDRYEEAVRKIFANTVVAHDGQKKDICFPEE